MTAWFVAGHSVANRDTQRGANVWTPRRTGFGRSLVEIYYFCPSDKQLDMVAGWVLWDMLMYGEQGGVAAADRAMVEKTGKSAHDQYYEYMVSSLVEDAEDWVDKKQGHQRQSTYGIWEVGQPSKPYTDMDPPKTISAVNLITQAALAGVDRIYWGSCQAWVNNGGRLTRPSTQVFYPPNLPRARA